MIVGRTTAISVRVNATLQEGEHSGGSQFPKEITQIKHDIPARVGLAFSTFDFRRAHIVRRQDYDSEPHVGVAFNLFDEGFACVRLLVQDDRTEPNSLDDERDHVLRPGIVTVHDENISTRCAVYHR